MNKDSKKESNYILFGETGEKTDIISLGEKKMKDGKEGLRQWKEAEWSQSILDDEIYLFKLL